MKLNKYLKDNINTIIAVLSLLALISGVLQASLTNFRITATSFLVLGTIGLFLSNYWIAKATTISAVIPQESRRRFSKKLRLLIHINSAILLFIFWAALLIIQSPFHYARILYSVGKYDAAQKQFEIHNNKTGGTVKSYLLLSKCYKKQGDLISYVTAFEKILTEEHLLKKLEDSGSEISKSYIHFELSLTYLLEDYKIQLYKMYPDKKFIDLSQKSRRHLTLALIDERNPAILALINILLGYAKASTSSESVSNEQKYSSSLTHFETAKMLVESLANIDESLFKKIKSQYCYWLGKSLISLNKTEEAKKQLLEGIEYISYKNKTMITS